MYSAYVLEWQRFTLDGSVSTQETRSHTKTRRSNLTRGSDVLKTAHSTLRSRNFICKITRFFMKETINSINKNKTGHEGKSIADWCMCASLDWLKGFLLLSVSFLFIIKSAMSCMLFPTVQKVPSKLHRVAGLQLEKLSWF